MSTPIMQSITDDQLAEIERLTEKRANAYGRHIVPDISSSTLSALITRLRAAEKDAGRYRALRDACGTTKPRSMLMPRVTDPMDFLVSYLPDGLDYAIDAAMQSENHNA